MDEGSVRYKWLALSLAAMAIAAMAVGLGGCSGTATDDSNNGMNTADHPPVTYQGHGNQTLGPVTLSGGNVTVNATGDAEEHVQMAVDIPWELDFSYDLVNNTKGEANTGDVAQISFNRSFDRARSAYAENRTYDVKAGDYLVKVTTKNESIRWEMTISQ